MDKDKAWNFDEYDWINNYDERMRNLKRLCYEETLNQLPNLTFAKQGNLVLDIGTGTGNSAMPFLKIGCKVIGIDPSEKMLDQAKDKANELQELFSVLHIDDPFLKLPFPDKHFDIIVSAYAIHHLTDIDKRRAITEMKRILKPNGHIAIADTMFKDADHKKIALAEHKDMEDEYQPILTSFPAMFESEGFDVSMHQISKLIWVMVAQLGK